jgi:hypothetical protein
MPESHATESHPADAHASASHTEAGGEEVTSGAANLFDLRNIIAVLFLGYGLALLVVGVTDTTEADLAKTGGIYLNTWTGSAMLVTAVVFGVWAKLRPLIPPTPEELAASRTDPRGH